MALSALHGSVIISVACISPTRVAGAGFAVKYIQSRRLSTCQLKSLQVCNASKPDSEVTGESDRTSLKNLDAQLASLANTRSKASTNASPPEKSDAPRWTPPKPEDWPEFDGGFLVYAAGVLVVLTVAANVLFSTADKSLPGYKPKPLKTSRIAAALQQRRDEYEAKYEPMNRLQSEKNDVNPQ